MGVQKDQQMSEEDYIFAARSVKSVQLMIDLAHRETIAAVAIYALFDMTMGKGLHLNFASLLYAVVILWRYECLLDVGGGIFHPKKSP